MSELYPEAAISWVTHHYREFGPHRGVDNTETLRVRTRPIATANGPSDWFTSGIQAQGVAKTASKPGNTLLRLAELDAAVRSAFNFSPCRENCTPREKQEHDILRRVRINEWGRIMLGQEKHMKDALHQRLLPGGRLWADMMLFDLWRAVRG